MIGCFYAMSNLLGYLISKSVFFSLVGFYSTSTIVGYLIPNPLYTYILDVYMIWFGWFLWHINHCGLFNAKSSLYIYIKYIWFGLVGFYGISTIVGYLMPKSGFFWLGWLLWHINHFWSFNAKSCFHIYIKYIWFHLVWFYGIWTIVGYLMPNPLYIKYLWFVDTFCRYTQLSDQTGQFLTIQLSISHLFALTLNDLS